MCDIEELRLFVNERLTAVAEDILAVFVRTIVQYQQQIDLQHRQLEFLTPQVTSDLQDFLHVSEEEAAPQERNSSLLQEEQQPPQIKEEQQELVYRPEEADGSLLTLLAAKSEYNENRETEHLANTSKNEHVKTQADTESCRGASQPSDVVQLLSSESDTDDSDDWEETREDQSLKTHNEKQTAEGQSLYLRNRLSRDLISAQLTPSVRTHTRGKTFGCTVCGKTFNRNGNLKMHIRTHTGEKPFSCTVCGKHFSRSTHLKRHARIHTGEKPFSCIICGKHFSRCSHLKKHMEIHTGEKSFVL